MACCIQDSKSINKSIKKIPLKTGDDIFIEFNFSNETISENWDCCWYTTLKEKSTIIVNILMYQPENDISIAICEEKMNNMVSKIMEECIL